MVAVSGDSVDDVTTLHYVVFLCVSLLVVAILAFAVVCVCRHRRRRHATDGKSPYTRGPPLRRGGNGASAAAAFSDFPLEFSTSSVQLVRDICDDHRFRGSRIYLGQLAVQPHGQRSSLPVVVRTLGVDADERTRSEFWRDVDALHALRHPHVTSVVGVTGRSTVGAAASVLLESGTDFINLHQYVVYAGNDPTSLDHAARLHIAVHIAAAMDYLSSRGIVHGDLASRNVTMTSTPGPNGFPPAIAKLSVGLSVGPALFPGDYQKLGPESPPLPVRWMSPEAIATGGRSMTTPADVWSYGITLWELYSAGCRPYEGFDDHELVELILSRQLLPCPPPPDSFQWSLDCPTRDAPQGPPPELIADGKLTSRGVACTAPSSHRGRRLTNDRCTSTASVSPERRHNDRQLLPQQPAADAVALRTVDVL